MTMMRPESVTRGKAGFTLIELAVVIVILGVLAAFGVPRFIRSVERTNAVAAFDYLASIRSAQDRYRARYDTYAADVADLDIKASPPRYFAVPASFSPSRAGTTLRDSWSLRLVRTGSPAGYGAYSVAFNEDGFDPTGSTIAAEPANTDINPIRK